MASLKSSILVVKKDIEKKDLDLEKLFGADVAKDASSALALVSKNNYYSVIIDLDTSAISDTLNLTESIKQKNINSQIILIRGSSSTEDLQKITNHYQIFKIHNSFQENRISYDIQESLAEYDLNKQNFDLLKIIEEQNERLKAITEDLESRVSTRTLNLAETKQKLLHTNQYLQTLISTFIAIQKSESIIDIEKNLLNLLATPLDASWVRIFVENTSRFTSDRKKNLQSQTIFEKQLIIDKKKIGDFVLARSNKKDFSKEELRLLRQISNALSLGLDRLLTQEKSDYLLRQWQATFDAIIDPVAIVNSDYTFVQTNKAMDSVLNDPASKFYNLLTNKERLSKDHELGVNYIFDNDIEVTSQLLEDNFQTKLYINHYKDLSERKKTERQILEASKLSNLGLIGSSIAHELNNPLAGLITFIQILKSDLEKSDDEKLLADITEMEKSALRCKDIISNLLSFTRMVSFDKKTIHLSDVINKAIRVLNVKTKSLGVEINFISHTKNDKIQGVENSLTQSLVNILQNSVDSVLEKKKSHKDFTPWIEVELLQDASKIHLDIKDNGIGIGKNDLSKVFSPFFTTKNTEQHRGLGLTIAYQIIKEHSGTIDLTSLSENLTCARISFQRPVL